MIDRSFWRRVAANWVKINNNNLIREAVEEIEFNEYIMDLHDELGDLDDELD